MTEELKQMTAKLVIAGAFEFRDKDGELLKTVEFKTEVPVTDEPNPRTQP